MKRTFKYNLAVIILILSTLAVRGQVYERSRSVREAFKAPPAAEIQVVNKYGDIHLVPWEKDSVVFEIDFTVTSGKQSKVDKIYDYVDFDFKATSYYIIAQTVFKGQNTFWTEMADVASSIFSGNTNTTINYTVYFPEKNDVRLENKFGNIFTTDHDGKVDISLSNGDLKAHSFNRNTNIKIDFGNAVINRMKTGRIQLNYAELTLEEAADVKVESKSSKVYLTSCNNLQLDTRRDKYYVKKAGQIIGSTYFTYLNLDQVTDQVNLTTTYGEVKVLEFSPSFRQADFHSEYTELSLYFDDRHSFRIGLVYDDKTQLVIGSGVNKKGEVTTDKDTKISTENLVAGKSSAPEAPVQIHIKAGSVNLTGF